MAVVCAIAAMLLSLASCNMTKHVPQGQYLLDNVDIKIADRHDHHISKTDLQSYIRQQPNHEVL